MYPRELSGKNISAFFAVRHLSAMIKIVYDLLDPPRNLRRNLPIIRCEDSAAAAFRMSDRMKSAVLLPMFTYMTQ